MNLTGDKKIIQVKEQLTVLPGITLAKNNEKETDIDGKILCFRGYGKREQTFGSCIAFLHVYFVT